MQKRLRLRRAWHARPTGDFTHPYGLQTFSAVLIDARGLDVGPALPGAVDKNLRSGTASPTRGQQQNVLRSEPMVNGE